MSTSLLSHAFGVRGNEEMSIRLEDGATVFAILQPRRSLRCAACGSAHVFSQGTMPREFRAVPTGGRPVRVRRDVPRVRCRERGVERQVAVRFATPKKSYTRSFARYVLDLSRHMTLAAVAQHLGMSWDLVKGIQREHLQRRFARPKLKRLEPLDDHRRKWERLQEAQMLNQSLAMAYNLKQDLRQIWEQPNTV